MNRIITTGDNSHSLKSEIYGESYHSSFGAVTESKHVFINNGLNKIQKNEISVFEAGFGTGLNAFLSMMWADEKKIKVSYTTIELFPLELNVVNDLNYPEILNADKDDFIKLHKSDWDKETDITQYFRLRKIRADLANYEPVNNIDVIFYDAFSPEVQPELWSYEIFVRLQKMLNQGGILVSYCVKGIVKKALRDAGFRVAVLPGPPGKRHMLYAVKEN